MNEEDGIKRTLIETIHRNHKLGKKYKCAHYNVKYKLNDIIDQIIYVLKTGISWRSLKSLNNMSWNTVYYHHKRFIEHKIYEKTFNKTKNIYINLVGEINGLCIDSSFIQNKNGKDKIARNKHYYNKKGTKLSLITDLNGAPLSVKYDSANVHDAKITEKHENDINKFKVKEGAYFMADKGYDSKRIRELIIRNKMKPLIPQNKRNIKNEAKIIKQTNEEKIKFRKRIIIENTFNKLKQYRKINLRYESKCKNYIGFVYIGLTKLILKIIEKIERV